MVGLSKSSHFVKIPNTNSTLHLRHFHGDGAVVFMLHGAVENGKIFYSNSDKGLAPFLARAGYDVYVMELQGRGQSHPPINKDSTYGQTEAILIDIPCALEFIKQQTQNKPQHWIGHSWGGVLLAAFLARTPNFGTPILSQVYFGSKRRINVKSWRKVIYIDFIWKRLCRWLVGLYGFLPAQKYWMGADSESDKSHLQSVAWVYGCWHDSDDNFDYGKALKDRALPPTWFIAAQKDHILGHPSDVIDFMSECGNGEQRYSLLSSQNGNLKEYNHIDMLTDPLAEKDHFPLVSEWMIRHEKKHARVLQ